MKYFMRPIKSDQMILADSSRPTKHILTKKTRSTKSNEIDKNRQQIVKKRLESRKIKKKLTN